ncbi:MAG: gliding motility-associated C-terminal domain-containing protein [Saprospiraceae bacterium]|nr:gliding motility-associated C-terminal domain-containing protein [Saprospiraceae bacterium]
MNERLPHMKLLTLLTFLTFSMSTLIAQPTFIMSDAEPDPGDTVEIDVEVVDFVKISAMQYLHSFDSLVLEYVDVIDKTPNLAGLSHLGPEGATVENGQIVITWNDPLGENVTLPDSEKIYTIQFVAIGSECDTSDISIIGTDTRKIEVLDENFDNIGLEQVEGFVMIPGVDCEGGGGNEDVVIRSTSASGPTGTEICVQIRVDNFTDIESMQFSMSWDESIITYSRVANFNLRNLNAGSFNNGSPGSLVCIWDPGTGMGETVNDGTRIFDLCFNIIGMSGDVSPVEFVDMPIPIEFNTSQGVTSFRTTNGRVTVTGGGGGGDVELILGDATGDCGDCNDPICIPLTVRNFQEVEAMQFSINYPEQLQFCEARNFMLSGLSEGNIFNPNAGVLRVVWDDPNAGSQSLPDDSKLMDLCFSSSVGDIMYDIEITDTPLKIEIFTSSGVADVVTTPGKITINPCQMMDFEIDLESTLDESCFGRCNGFISIDVSGGSGQYEFVWTKDGQPFDTTTVNQLFDLCGGNYSVTVTDVNDPSNSESINNIVIIRPDELTGQVVTVPVMNGCDGEACVIVDGGTQPYFYRWSNGVRDSCATDLCKGDYNCTITDMNNCVLIIDTFTLTGPPLVLGTPEITQPTCFGDCNGAILIAPSGGCGDYTFNWEGMGITDPTRQNQTGLCAGQYNVTVTDTMGTSVMTTITVNQPDSIKIELDSILNGASGAIFISVSGGTGPGTYNYAWEDEDGILVSQNEDPSQLEPGTYTVIVSDANGCARSKTYTVSLSDLNLLAEKSEYEGGVNVRCNGGSDGSITVTVMEGIGPFTYSWDHDPAATGPTQSDLPAGVYRITVMDQANGSTKVITVTLNEPDPLDAQVALKSCADFEDDPSGSYEVIPSGGTAPYTYLWCNNSSARVPINLPGGENCNVLVTDANGCQIFMDSVLICFDDDTTGTPGIPCFEGRDVITPNGDSYNEFLVITCVEEPRFQDNELYIFNRWGQEINSFDGYENEWNGLDENGEEVDEDTYMWVLKVVLPSGETDVYRGAVTLLRN